MSRRLCIAGFFQMIGMTSWTYRFIRPPIDAARASRPASAGQVQGFVVSERKEKDTSLLQGTGVEEPESPHASSDARVAESSGAKVSARRYKRIAGRQKPARRYSSASA